MTNFEKTIWAIAIIFSLFTTNIYCMIMSSDHSHAEYQLQQEIRESKDMIIKQQLYILNQQTTMLELKAKLLGLQIAYQDHIGIK